MEEVCNTLDAADGVNWRNGSVPGFYPGSLGSTPRFAEGFPSLFGTVERVMSL
jgi:hypothetical protein